jgi:hypothetical protein
MLNMECRTGLPGQKVIERLKKFFGSGGLGLDLTEEAEGCLTFSGGGGYVTATLCEEKGKIRVDLETREWEYQVKEFASTLR